MVREARRRAAVAMVLGLVVTACGDGGSSSGLSAETPVRVADALRADADAIEETVSVSGWLLLQQDGPALLCDHGLDSRPPACGAPGLPVEGVDVAEMPGSTTVAGVTWVEDVTVQGRLIAGGVDVADDLTAVPEDQSEVSVRLRRNES